LNRETVNVNQKPRVAIISVGDELTAPFQGASNMFVNNNAYIIASLIEAFKADPLLIEIAQDTFEDVTQKIITSTRKADIIITIAGCSVGAKDFVPDVVENGDGDGGLIFHGVALNAGKVSGFGLVRSKPVAMLPGHVESTVAAFHLFVLPLLNRYLGVGFRDHLPTIKCVLDEPIWKGKPGVDLVLPMKIYRRDAEYHAIPMRKPPSVLKNIADANGFALIHDGVALKAGEVITVKLYSSLEFNTQRIAKDHNEEYQRLYATDVLSAISNEQRKID
jgi:molybdopterin molybdotransferase